MGVRIVIIIILIYCDCTETVMRAICSLIEVRWYLQEEDYHDASKPSMHLGTKAKVALSKQVVF